MIVRETPDDNFEQYHFPYRSNVMFAYKRKMLDKVHYIAIYEEDDNGIDSKMIKKYCSYFTHQIKNACDVLDGI